MPTVIVNWDRALASVRKYPDATIRTAIGQVLRSDPHLTRYIAASGGENNVLDTLMIIFKEAIRQSSADTKYFLEKLKKQNAFASQLTDYLVRLAELSRQLADAERPKGENDRPYECEPARPSSWLASLPVMQVTIPIRRE